MRKKLTISIITPSLNQGNFLGDAYESIFRQDLGKRLEYIILDANSTDNTLEVTKKFLPKFKKQGIKVKFIQEKDRGQSDAINKGWKMSVGDILGYLNCDDFYQPNVLLSVIKYFEENPQVKWIYGGYNMIHGNGKKFKTLAPFDFNQGKLLNSNFIAQPSCFFRRELLSTIGFLNENLHLSMDYDLWLRIAARYPAGTINKIISNMRFHASAKSSKYAIAQSFEGLIISLKYTPVISWRRIVQYFYFTLELLSIIKHKWLV